MAKSSSAHTRLHWGFTLASILMAGSSIYGQTGKLGAEVAVERHLQDGEEFELAIADLIDFGKQLFLANWTIQEGGGRPLTKGTGEPIVDRNDPLVFPRGFNRISGPDANSCAGCHNVPFAGGGGDFVSNVFVLAQRFDAVSFDPADTQPTKGAVDEKGRTVTLATVANSRASIGMFGSGFIEMLARQMSGDLQAIRDSIPPGGSRPLVTKGVSFGVLARFPDGRWDVSKVEGLPSASLVTGGPSDPPDLLIRPFHQAGRVVSLREFSNNAFNHHHGIQPTERFGLDTDPDGDGVRNEFTRADVTAVTLFQATLPVPGRLLPGDPQRLAAVRLGEQRFESMRCATCHVPRLPLDRKGWIFTEPGPYNPAGNLRAGEAPTIEVDLTSDELPGPRLKPDENGIVWVPAFTDLKLHDICSGPDDPNIEPLDMQFKPGTPEFFGGNRKFLTKKLWGAANEPPYFHHGMYTTMREAILAHGGEADESRRLFEQAIGPEQDAVIEFLKTLQVLPEGSRSLVLQRSARPIRALTRPR